jgi:peptidoglycan/LPS O-acetylase OafA/YrhL
VSPGSTRNAGYRPEIDGLRALAVVPIVLFHIGFPGLDGGFVGVDIFFVISGFLITGILARELAEGRFSLARFYERRVRRILPALFAAVTATGLAAWLLFLPEDLSQFGKSAIATLAFACNFLFARQVDYFAAPALFKPLLHCWSLAVEEQFYLFFPLLLAMLWPLGRRRTIAALAVIAALSLVLAQIWLDGAPQRAFFWSPARAWELLAGSLLALGALPRVCGAFARQALAGLGLILIAGSVILLDETMPFPGLAAIPPVLGSALILHCAQGTLGGRLLQLRPLRFIGWISYSLYLWHWPVVVFLNYRLGPLGLATKLAALAMCLILATASWRWIEEPARRGAHLGGWRAVGFAAGGSAALAALGAVLVVGQGFPGRLSPEVRGLAAAVDDFSPRRQECHASASHPILPQQACRYGSDVPADAALWADSSGVEPLIGLGEEAARRNRSILHFTHSACSPAARALPHASPECNAFNQATLAWLSRPRAPAIVILSAAADSPQYRADPAFQAGLLDAAEALRRAGKRVILVGPVPSYPSDVPRRVALAWQSQPGTMPQGVPIAKFLSRNRAVLASLQLARSHGFAVLLPHEQLCRESCDLVRGGKVLYFDDHHLSVEGGRIIAAPLADLVWQTLVLSQ